jgi:protein TonB
MFDNLVESSGTTKNARTGVFFIATAAVWMLVLLSVIVIGIFMYDAKLSADFEREIALVAAPPPPPPPPPPPAAAASTPKVTPVVTQGFVAQQKPPEKISPPSPRPPSTAAAAGTGVPGGVPGGVVGGELGGVVGGVMGGTPGGVVPPPPPPVPPKVEAPAPPKVQRVSGGVLTGKATRRVQPPYPSMAKTAGIEGTVVVEVTVAEGGSVISARAVSGHPLLRDAAVGAARQWAFSPTLLSGVPVKVIGTIAFNFKKS